MDILKRLFILIHWICSIVFFGTLGLIAFSYSKGRIEDISELTEFFFYQYDDDIVYLLWVSSFWLFVFMPINRWVIFNELVWLPWKKGTTKEDK